MEANEKIMGKIANLMAKTVENGCTAQEAAAAATMAQKLIAKYHVDMRCYSDVEEIEREETGITRSWQHSLATIVAANMCCKVIGSTTYRNGKRQKTLIFVGRDTDRKSCMKVFDMLMEVCRKGIAREKRLAQESYGKTMGVEGFYSSGFISAVEKELEAQCRALVLVVPEAVEEKYHEFFPNAKKTPRRKISYYSDMRQGLSGIRERGEVDGREAASRKALA